MRASRIIRIGTWTAALAATLAGAGAALAAGQETTAPQHYWLPETVSTFGHTVDKLFYFILYLTVAVNIAVFVALGYFLVKYRHKAGRHATFIHGNSRLETVWTLIPTIVLALTAVFSETSWSSIKKFTPAMAHEKDVIEVEVVAQQFLWNFHYPGKDGKLGPRKVELINKNGSPDEQIGLDRSNPDAKDDYVTNLMVIPVNRRVYIHLASRDVIHSFFLPNFRVKQDAVPGMTSRIWLEAEKTSGEVVGNGGVEDFSAAMAAISQQLPNYVKDADQLAKLTEELADAGSAGGKPFDIACAELCGQGHYKMRGKFYVVTDRQYHAFLDGMAAISQPAAAGEDY